MNKHSLEKEQIQMRRVVVFFNNCVKRMCVQLEQSRGKANISSNLKRKQ